MRSTTLLIVIAVAVLVSALGVGWWRTRDRGTPVAEVPLPPVTTPVPDAPAQVLRPSDADPNPDPNPPGGPTTTYVDPISPGTVPIEVADEVPFDQLLIDEITVTSVVSGMTLAPDDRLGTGPIDLARAADAEPDREAELALLRTRSFVAGFSRAFERDGEVVYLQVYRFGSADDAAAYLLDGADTILARGAEPYDVDPLPGALGFTESDPQTGFTGHAVSFTVGRHHVLVIAGGSSGLISSADARAVATAQHAHLVDLTVRG